MFHSSLAGLLVPPLCVACRSRCDRVMPLCPECVSELNRAPVIRDSPPPGITRVASCAPHEGVARALLAAFKFRGLVGLAPLIAGYMADLDGTGPPERILVPVPAAPGRERRRGFDPARELAREAARVDSGALPEKNLLVRRGSGRQRGRGREARLGLPPTVEPVPDALPAGAPSGVLTLVDDVLTTGATLTACAAALAGAGAGPVSAITFTRRL